MKKKESQKESFLGRGWKFPPSFHRCDCQEGACHHTGTVAMVGGEKDVQESLHILLTTELGERLMQPEFGCELAGFLFEEVNQTLVGNITRLVTNAILYHEPRITLNDLSVEEDSQEPGLLLIGLDYTVRATNSRFNMVYPYYLTEATTRNAG